jgi:hypothetical protein
MSSVEKRLLALERENRTLRIAAIAFGVIVAYAAVSGQSPPPVSPETLTARRLQIEDDSGMPRIVMDGPSGILSLDDEAGNPRVVLALGAAGPSISLHDARGAARLRMALLGKRPTIDLLDNRAKSIASFSMLDNSTAVISMSDDNGKVKAALGSFTSGPALLINSSDGSDRIALSAPEDEASLQLTDGNGYSLALGNSGLVSRKTGTGQRTTAASIVMFGSNRHVIWEAP